MQDLSHKLVKALFCAYVCLALSFATAKTLASLEPSTNKKCLLIEQLALVDLQGQKIPEFDWLLKILTNTDAFPTSRSCLNSEELDALLKFAQGVLIKEGFVTTRVLFRHNSHQENAWVLTVIPGRIGGIRFSNPQFATTDLSWAFPMKTGDLLNVRDIEQALENLKRIPTADADIQIVPSSAIDAELGESDLSITYQNPQAFRIALTVDDSGTLAIGKYQSSATLRMDNPLRLNDMFYLTHNQDLGGGKEGARGTHGDTLHYSIPIGYSLLSATLNQGSYHQSLASQSKSYVYRGFSENNDIQLSHVVARDAHQKFTLALGAFQRKTKNYIDDTEIQNQKRVEGGWYSKLNHKIFIQSATLDSTLTFKRGTHAFGALPAPEQSYGEGTSQFIFLTGDVHLSWPFQVDGQGLRYNSTWRLQSNRTALTPPNRLSIGGRNSVRGFDGELVLTGDSGWVWRNDFNFLCDPHNFPISEIYIAIDQGEVAGQSTSSLVGTRLAGAAFGVRGLVAGMHYDIFIGQALIKPKQFVTASNTMGFSVTANF